MKEAFEKVVAKMTELKNNEVILVDGYIHENSSFVDCIPRNLPLNIKLIYSCDRNKTDVMKKIIGDEVWYKLELENFDNQCSRRFIEAYLNKFNKVRVIYLINLIIKIFCFLEIG